MRPSYVSKRWASNRDVPGVLRLDAALQSLGMKTLIVQTTTIATVDFESDDF